MTVLPASPLPRPAAEQLRLVPENPAVDGPYQCPATQPRVGNAAAPGLALADVAVANDSGLAHVAAALWHQFVRKDGLFARMSFGRRSS